MIKIIIDKSLQEERLKWNSYIGNWIKEGGNRIQENEIKKENGSV